MNWDAPEYAANYLVYDTGKWVDSTDLSAGFKMLWDEDYLYISFKVKDEKYQQQSTGLYLYQGDSVEVLVDTDVQDDFYTRSLNWDDFQIGASAGQGAVGADPEAYIWFPTSVDGPTTKVKVGAQTHNTGYRISMAIPWSLLGVDPYTGARFGFAASVSDDDSKNGETQQTMISSSPYRILTDPTSWGDLILVK